MVCSLNDSTSAQLMSKSSADSSPQMSLHVSRQYVLVQSEHVSTVLTLVTRLHVHLHILSKARAVPLSVARMSVGFMGVGGWFRAPTK